MFRDFFNKLYRFGIKVANIGITPELNFHEKKKTQLLNLLVSFSIPTTLFFFIVNLVNHKPLLSLINFLILGGEILIPVINSYGKFLLARLILTFLASILFTISAILFRNGAEYFLLANLVVIIIYFNEKRFLISISLVNCLLFIGIKIFLDSSIIYDAVPFGRVVFNIVWTLLAMAMALLFFKNEQLSYQEQVEEKNRDLQKMNDTKEKLFSIISHDLRSPIGQLKGLLQLVSDQQISPETFQQFSSKLSTEVDSLHSTLDNLLRWSISQLQGIKAMPEKVDLEEMVRLKFAMFKQPAEQKNIRLIAEDLHHYVWADPNHVQLVLRNLISNAIKYSYENGRILVRSSVKDQMVIIEVNDTGMGMSEEMKQSIFKPENIVSNRGTANERGTGLGLKLCKEFVEKNNGIIWVDRTKEKGSSFFFSLPLAK